MFEVEVAAVDVDVPVGEHVLTAVQTVGLDAAFPKYPVRQALQVVPVYPVLQLHTAVAVVVAGVVDDVPEVKHTVTAEQTVGDMELP